MLRCSCRLVLLSLAFLLLSPAARPAPLEPKRRNPEVLAPVEFQADVARVCIRTYMINEDRKKAYMAFIDRRRGAPELMWMEKDELQRRPGVEFARDIVPVQVAVVCASFPYRKQIEAFQEALRLRSVANLADEPGAFPRFLGLNVERREVSPEKTEWQSLDLDSAESPFVSLVKSTLGELQPEPDEWEAVRVKGLATPLPVLARDRYPECSLPLLKKTLADPKARALPDYCLLRFLDVTVQPGRTYEYRMRIRMANPNFGKKNQVEKAADAEVKELLGPSARVPGTVAVSRDVLHYAVDVQALDPKFPGPPAGREHVAFQIHRWMSYYEWAPPKSSTTFFPVGCWVVAERVLVSRGTLVGGRQKVTLPVWSPEQKGYVKAGRPGAGGVEVDFGRYERPVEAPLLVDFEGGKLSYKGTKTEAPIEVLLLSPDGKLLARDSATDAADPARKERSDAWKKWLKDGTPPR
jgi:hypothetical protein